MLAAQAHAANDAIRISILVLLPWQQRRWVVRCVQQMWCSTAAPAAEFACFDAVPQAGPLAR
jgi:hypothetical protein